MEGKKGNRVRIVPDARLPFDLRVIVNDTAVAKVYGIDAKPNTKVAQRIADALQTDTPTYEIQQWQGRWFVYEHDRPCHCCGNSPQMMHRILSEDGYRSENAAKLALQMEGLVNE